MYQVTAPSLLEAVIMIARQRGAGRPMTRIGAGPPYGEGPPHDSARPGAVWGQATDGFNRWVAGDPAGLDDLVAGMTPVLWHGGRASRLSGQAAEDVIQTTWMALVRRRAAIVDPVAVGG